MATFNTGHYMLVAGLICSLSFAFFLAIIRSNYPQSISGTLEWLGSCIAFGAASVFASGTLGLGEYAEQFLSRVFHIGAMILVLIGLRRFAGKTANSPRLAVILVCSTVLLSGIRAVGAPQKLPVLLTMVVLIALAHLCISEALALPDRTKPEYCVAVSLFSFIILYTIRIISVAFDMGSASLYLDDRFAQQIYVLGFGPCFVFLMGSLLLLGAKRLRQALMFAEVYDEIDVQQRADRWRMGEELRHSIEHNELEVYYQPRVDGHSGEVVAVEALLRWKHASNGYIRPDLFIPIAEENGFIHVLGAWVLREGAAFAARLSTQCFKVRVSINVSAKQLARPEFVECVRLAIRRAGIAPDMIELELTESIAMEDPEGATATLRELREIGVHLSIDDFGTGYSSLAYLTRLPVTCLKIDRSFVCDVTTSKDAKALTQAIIGLGSALGLRIVAEGVETQAQLDLLRDWGIHEYQGYLFSKPIPEQALISILSEASPQYA